MLKDFARAYRNIPPLCRYGHVGRMQSCSSCRVVFEALGTLRVGDRRTRRIDSLLDRVDRGIE